MKYAEVRSGKFLERPNRFIAYVETGGTVEKCHVSNTGRCRELLVPGADVILSVSRNPNRSTKYDLVSVYKGGMLVNIDSQAPNKVVIDQIRDIPGFENADLIRPEYSYGSSRIDLYAEEGSKKMLMEIKGVTLERDGLALFPDAPTERGLKHVGELKDSLKEGYESYIMFLVQMRGPEAFSPNYDMHEDFAAAVEQACTEGMKVLAYDCVVTENSVSLGEPIDIRFRGHS
ncbi:MAG: DNA/RNA nuclease SfsA [Candidatus Methanoplasma sp.]|jgi:sugar fermentation stimulation protein A|nr:DNA/RNA nuclease SfsA [Candidatus Methanoplasma sp.]